jgi:hypothetical protein
VINTADKKERKVETNMSLYLKRTKMRTKDTRYKPEGSTWPSYEACEYFRVIQKKVSHEDDSGRGLNISPVKNVKQ